jgi:hypothetical protein
MTDRDPQTGQFTETPAEPETGKIAELHQSGYRTLSEHEAEREEPKVYGSDVRGLRDAAADHDLRQSLESWGPTEIDDTALRPEPLPADVALDLKQASERDHQHRQAEARVAELGQTKSEALQILEDLGFDPDQSEAEWQKFFNARMAAAQGRQPQGEPLHQIVEQAQQQPVQQATDPQQEARELIEKNPVLRQAVESEIAKAQQQQAQYQQAAQMAAHLAYADLVGDDQQLRREGYRTFQQLAEADPKRALAYQAKNERTKVLIGEYERLQQHQSAQRQAIIAHGERQADALIVQRHPELAQPGEMQRAQDQIRDLLNDYGINPQTLPPELRTNPAVHEFLLQSARMHAGQKQLKAAQREAARPATPVQKPGVQAPPRNRAADEYQRLQRQLARETGTKALRTAAAMHNLRTKGR